MTTIDTGNVIFRADLIRSALNKALSAADFETAIPAIKEALGILDGLVALAAEPTPDDEE